MLKALQPSGQRASHKALMNKTLQIDFELNRSLNFFLLIHMYISRNLNQNFISLSIL